MLVQAVRLQTVRVQAIRLGTVYGQAFSQENNGTTTDGRMSGASTDGVRTGGLVVPECESVGAALMLRWCCVGAALVLRWCCV